MEAAVVVTYRCNARCKMCNTWQFPSKPVEEITPEVIDKIPGGMTRLNITGGEPMLRRDIEDIVAVLHKKTNRLEISTNGFFTDKIVSIAKKYPDITIRVSLEGFPATNDSIRGIKDGFHRGLYTIVKLMELGIKDIGFATVVQDGNYKELVDFYRFVSSLGVEYSICIGHNSFYFHKTDNEIINKDEAIGEMENLIRALLTSKRKDLKLKIKDWFRAYLTRGLIRFARDDKRALNCGAGSDVLFLDPYGEVFPCNVMERSMGNIKKRSFYDVWNSEEAKAIRETVCVCTQNCWMMGTAVPAMRKAIWNPVSWVVYNKIRLFLGKNVVGI
ncbi:MAG: radical SAM protein [Nitrospiraceae bacterium]|nr:MAG: radical SAM protein [Nitrospiraceae bacterium]